ncbi:DNA polymerase IV [Deltaproteobacteria bacterium TL4]
MTVRKIIHIDMDAFYASVEQLDAPELKGKPLIVGGSPESRGVVAAASYEARKYGIHSAMPTSRAYHLCPGAIFLFPRFSRYKEISAKIHEIFKQYTEIIEPLSLDEAWLDVTENKKGEPSATRLAQQIKRQIKEEIGLTCSAGISYNKFLAKIATEEKKPDGLYVILPEKAQDFILKMNVRKIPYVGKVTAKKLEEQGVTSGQDLYEKSEEFLVEHFGKFGHELYERVRGIDDRPVVVNRERKSISTENTYSKDLRYGIELLEELQKLVDDLMKRMDRQSMEGRTLTLKVKFHDFLQITRSISKDDDFSDFEEIYTVCQQKLDHVCHEEFPNKAIRLLGVGISNLDSPSQGKAVQLDFFHILDRQRTYAH